MGRSCANAIKLPFAVKGRRGSLADPLGVEPHAPAAAKDAVVALHQRGEGGPRRLIESLDGVRRFDPEAQPNRVGYSPGSRPISA
jgi:hypothetical protein